MNRGDVWWVERPDHKRRPFLVLTREAAIPVLNRVIAVPSTTSRRGIPTEGELGPEDGMPRECALRLDAITAVGQPYFVERICTLSPQRMHEVCRALALATGCG